MQDSPLRTPSAPPDVKGLATLALLKANFDSGKDHIEMFMPFVLDSVGAHSASDFALEDLRPLLESRHGLRIPSTTLRTILSRAVKRGALRREGGRYFRDTSFPKTPDLTCAREAVVAEQSRLAAALAEFAQANALATLTEADALALLLQFLGQHHVGLILEADIAAGAEALIGQHSVLSSRDQRLVAAFVTRHVLQDPSLLDVLRRMLEGFVLQNALLLRDISAATRRFAKLTVFFDTGFLLSALGLNGEAAGLAARETLDLLRDTGARLAVFDNTLNEIKRILRVYEDRLATADGISSLHPTGVTRYVLTHRFSPSDIREQIALLEANVRGLGIAVHKAPLHDRRWTLDEPKLTEMIRKPQESDLHPRVIHDVDCIAAVLTLRAGHSCQTYDDARAVFATTTGLLVTNVRDWYQEQGEPGVPPVIHQLALSNIAWLKRPASGSKLKLHELVALCSAALVPGRRVWELFIKHLRELRASGRLSSDEAVAIVVNELTDSLLSRFDDEVDADADTIAEVVERVRDQHRAEAQQTIELAKRGMDETLAAEALARRAAEEEAKKKEEALRKLILSLRSRSAAWARRLSWALFLAAAVVVVVGSSVPVSELLGWRLPAARIVGYGITAFVWFLGIAGLLWGGYLGQWRRSLESRLDRLFRRWLLGRHLEGEYLE